MTKEYCIPYMGPIPSLTTTHIQTPENPEDLLVHSHAFYRRYAVQIADEGLSTFGIDLGDYLLFREQRWPSLEGQICLLTMGDEVTIKMLECINNPTVTLRVGGDQILPLELGTTDFCVIGVLDGVIKKELATFTVPKEDMFVWDEA